MWIFWYIHTRTYTRTAVIECLKLLELQMHLERFFMACSSAHACHSFTISRVVAQWRVEGSGGGTIDRRWSHFLIFVMTRAFILFFLNKISKR